MNAGLGTLTELKTQLLNEGLRGQTGFDAALLALGKGVAARFDQYCNRKFARAAGDLYETNADRLTVMLPRYPVEAISKVEIRASTADGWVDQGDPAQLLFNRRDSAGIVDIGGWLGGRLMRLRFTYTGGFWWASDDAPALKHGSVDLASGAGSASVSFDSAFTSAPQVFVSLVAPDGGTVISILPATPTASGFTVRFGAPLPSSGYSLAWIAALGTSDVMQQASTAVATSAETLAVVFPTAFSAAPHVLCGIVAPDGGTIISTQPSAVTVSGFTAQFGFPLPAGYSLVWIAFDAAAASAITSLPSGATARPDDLYLAWLLQCEAAWQLRDKLGISLGEAQETRRTLTLGNLTLVPEVEATLQKYKRYALT